MIMWKLVLLTGVGGFFGTIARFLINRLFLVIWKAPFPLATFTINIIGCFLFGLLCGVLNKNNVMPPEVNALLMVGFCGGFTTFSTFSFESFSLLQSGQAVISLAYMAVSVILGIVAVWFGLALSR